MPTDSDEAWSRRSRSTALARGAQRLCCFDSCTTVVDRGVQAAEAVAAVAARLEHRLDVAVVTPAVRTPLERSLAER